MKNLSFKKVLQIVLSILVIVFCVFAITKGQFITEKDRIKDADVVESFVKFNLLTHDGMNLSESVPTFSGKDKIWSQGVSSQIEKYLSGAPYVYKMSGDPYVYSYKLIGKDGNVSFVVWFDNGGDENIGSDTTVSIYVGEMQNLKDVVITERLLGAGETEPLVRGYLVDENKYAKITVTERPVFVYVK